MGNSCLRWFDPMNKTSYNETKQSEDNSWLNIIEEHVGKIEKLPESWKKVVNSPQKGKVKEFANIVDKFYKSSPSSCKQQWTPFHIAAEFGNLDLYQFITEKSENKNEARIDGVTPLHLAAEFGHFSVCEFILQYAINQNPEDNLGWTPLHWSAQNGHLEVCKIILDKIHDKNPEDIDGMTPLHCAALNGKLETYR